MYFTEENFINDYTLNIFSDASMMHKKSIGCYGAIAKVGNKLIDKKLDISTNTTNNNAEIKGLRSAVFLAMRYQNIYPNINIFSDSQISIFGIRDRIFNWTVSGNTLYGYGRAEIQSQEIFLEIMNYIVESNLRVSFWHQKGHVKTNNFNSINDAAHTFCASNRVRDKVDLNFIKYISDNNNFIDYITGEELKKNNFLNKTEPLIYNAGNFKEVIGNYKEQINY